MKPKQTALLAAAATGVAATFLAALTATPEAVTQLVIGMAALLALGVVLVILFCTRWPRSLPPAGQIRTIWLAAILTGIVVCLFPLLLSIFR